MTTTRPATYLYACMPCSCSFEHTYPARDTMTETPGYLMISADLLNDPHITVDTLRSIVETPTPPAPDPAPPQPDPTTPPPSPTQPT